MKHIFFSFSFNFLSNDNDILAICVFTLRLLSLILLLILYPFLFDFFSHQPSLLPSFIILCLSYPVFFHPRLLCGDGREEKQGNEGGPNTQAGLRWYL